MVMPGAFHVDCTGRMGEIAMGVIATMGVSAATRGTPVTATTFDRHLFEAFTPPLRQFTIQLDGTQPY